MNATTPSDLESLRQALLQRLRELRAELQAETGQRDTVDPGEVTDRKDSATQRQFAEVRDAEEQRDIDELVRVEAALHRIDSGHYGDCLQCGEAIAPQRLRVQPAALRCAACQSALEHARGAQRA